MNVYQYLPLVRDRFIDFVRVHLSDIRGSTPARKLAALCEYFGVRTAWHGPGDASPVAHAALWPSERPGLGIDLDEVAAARFPIPEDPLNGSWPEVRLRDTTVSYP
ncbi:MAG: enolase C-terminal domain-like protein [Acidimicrobiales bacterium]